MHPSDKFYDLDSNKIFVFGSNMAGIHGAGAAYFAMKNCQAAWGVPFGLTGKAFAIPTKDARLNTLSLETVKEYVLNFIAFAKCHPELQFFVTRIGCGLAGFTDHEIAPLFKEVPDNCELPHGWSSLRPPL